MTEKQLLSGKQEEIEQRVINIVRDSIPLHEQNKAETTYLKDFLYGEQDIYTDKQKFTRTEINNKTVENWAYAMVDFKKTYLLGKAIQYVQLNDSGEEEISTLNKYVRFVQKQAKDLMIYEDILTCGHGYRFVGNHTIEEEGQEAPFELVNTEVEHTEVIYSSKLGNEQLLAYIETPMQDIITQINEETLEDETIVVPYTEFTVYLRDRVLTINDKDGELKVIDRKPLLTKNHRITEYYTNRKRISLIELGKDLFNDINYLESMDKDDMEQYVNAIMVFTNAEIDEQGLKSMKSMGAVCINSTENKRASIDLLQGRLNAEDTQTYYRRLLTALHQILGIPMASDTGTITSGDTGKAKLTGQGFTSAGIRAEGEECMFGMCDMESLRCILEICRTSNQSEIKKLVISGIDKKFQRDMTDNLLVKTEALQNLYACDIPRKFANSIIGLFGDPNSVTKEQERLFGDQVSQTGAGKSEGNDDSDTKNPGNTNETNDNASILATQYESRKQSNEVKKALEKDNQGQ